MTPDQLTELAQRLLNHAAMHDSVVPNDDELRQWRDDLIAAAKYLRRSAQADAVEALRRLVVAIIDDDGDDPGNAPGHAHSRPGIWDDDNEPAIAGKPCEKCAAWSNARAVLAAQGGKDE